ncbi:MAG: FAD-dependent oxidoreductase [Planctomycetota bacterium]
MSALQKQRIIILGGGFGGVYAAIHLEKKLKYRTDIEVILVSKENYFVFQPMLAEVVSGSIGILDTVSPLRRLLPRTTLFIRDVEEINLEHKTVSLSPGFRPRQMILPYDHLVLALGSVTDFRGLPGLYEHAFPFKNLADAVALRNHLIHVLEEASIEPDPETRKELLTFVIGGGGFSGVEVAAEMNDFLREVAPQYRGLKPEEIHVILIHSGERILDRELTPDLGEYAQNILRKRGVDIRLKTRLRTASQNAAILQNGDKIPSKTVVSTVPSSPHPLVDLLALPKARGKLQVDGTLQVTGSTSVWALGDCALVPCPGPDGFCPPTAQHAVRQAELLAKNLLASIDNKPQQTFQFTGLGKMGSLGHRSAVAQIIWGIKLSGILAWFFWRTVYWWKLPGLDRKLRVGISWFIDLLLPPDFVQLKLTEKNAIAQAHFEPGEMVFEQGDVGDCLYILVEGEVEILVTQDGEQKSVARLSQGEYFGEMALLKHQARSASVRCVTSVELLILRRGDFQSLVSNLADLRCSMENVMEKRLLKVPQDPC